MPPQAPPALLPGKATFAVSLEALGQGHRASRCLGAPRLAGPPTDRISANHGHDYYVATAVRHAFKETRPRSSDGKSDTLLKREHSCPPATKHRSKTRSTSPKARDAGQVSRLLALPISFPTITFHPRYLGSAPKP